MIASTCFHTFSAHSEYAHRSWQEADHFGIICALFGLYVPFLCQSFNCNPVSISKIYLDIKNLFCLLNFFDNIFILLNEDFTNVPSYFLLQEIKNFHLVVVCSMVFFVFSSKYVSAIGRFTMYNGIDKHGIQLKTMLMVASYFFVPLFQWIWMHRGLRNQVVLVILIYVV